MDNPPCFHALGIGTARRHRGIQNQGRAAAAAPTGAIPPATDLAFHKAIAAATANEHFPAALAGLEPALPGLMTLGLRLTQTGAKNRAGRALDEHALILDGIAAQDPDAAETAMRFHLSRSRRRMIDRNRDR